MLNVFYGLTLTWIASLLHPLSYMSVLLWSLTFPHGTDEVRIQVWSLMIIHSSFIRNMWIIATPSACVTLPYTYPHVLTLLTSNSLLSVMIASLASVIQLSLTYPHILDEAQMNNHQASYLVSIPLIFVIQWQQKNRISHTTTKITHMWRKWGHTSEFLFGIYWWTWKTTIY